MSSRNWKCLIGEEERNALLEKCKDVLKKNGKLLITTPNVASFGRRILLLLGKNPFLEYSLHLLANGAPPVGHVRYYTEQTLRHQLLIHKFSKIHIEGNGANFFFFSTALLNNVKPSFCMMLLGVANK